MKRDIAVVQLSKEEELVIASDNSGAIGKKRLDDVSVSYKTVSYYSFRVALMECIAAGASPFSVVIQNFNGDEAWKDLVAGVEQAMKEIELDHLSITGSTETNFELVQSAVGLTVLGKRGKTTQTDSLSYSNQVKVATIGKPLVGDEVNQHEEEIAPLDLFQWFCRHESVSAVLPVGSKGILYELGQLFANQSLSYTSELDMQRSSGPSTCFIVVYPRTVDIEVQEKAGKWFHAVDIENDENK